jgi:hypothetical protein
VVASGTAWRHLGYPCRQIASVTMDQKAKVAPLFRRPELGWAKQMET